MNGFAAEGFANGLVTGLEAVNKLVDSADKRRNDANELAYRKRYWDASAAQNEADARFKEQQAASQDLELAQKREELDRSKRMQQWPEVERILTETDPSRPGFRPFNERDFESLKSIGIDPSSFAQPGLAQQIQSMGNDIMSGRRDINDPEALKTFAPFVNNFVQRDIGGVSRDDSGKPFRVATKEVVGFDTYVDPKDQQRKYNPKIVLKGADDEGRYVETSPRPYTLYGSSDPRDPVAFLTDEQMINTSLAAMNLNRQIHENPGSYDAFVRYAKGKSGMYDTKPISALDEARVAKTQEEIRTEQLQQRKTLAQTETEGYQQARQKYEALIKLKEYGGWDNKAELDRKIKEAELELKNAQIDSQDALTQERMANRNSKKAKNGSAGPHYFDPAKAEQWMESQGYGNKSQGGLPPKIDTDPAAGKQRSQMLGDVQDMMSMTPELPQAAAQTVVSRGTRTVKPINGVPTTVYVYQNRMYPVGAAPQEPQNQAPK